MVKESNLPPCNVQSATASSAYCNTINDFFGNAKWLFADFENGAELIAVDWRHQRFCSGVQWPPDRDFFEDNDLKILQLCSWRLIIKAGYGISPAIGCYFFLQASRQNILQLGCPNLRSTNFEATVKRPSFATFSYSHVVLFKMEKPGDV